MNYDWRFMTFYKRQGSRSSPWKRNAKSKMATWGGLTNTCDKKRSEKRRLINADSAIISLRWFKQRYVRCFFSWVSRTYSASTCRIL